MSSIFSYERLNATPSDDVARRIADVLGKQPAELFPEKIKEITAEVKAERNARKIGNDLLSLSEIPEDELVSTDNPVENAHRNLLYGGVQEALRCLLTYKEREILALRFGLNNDSQTLEEVGRVFRLNRERIRQIEAGALKKLQHPERASKLERFLY